MTIEYNELDCLIDAIACLLETAEKPLSEYELIKRLNQQGWGLSINAADSLALFQSHFLVYHALYRLQVQYWDQEQGFLSISALEITLLPLSHSTSGSAELSPFYSDASLRDYYLNLSNLDSATEDSVDQLLSQFWSRYLSQDDELKALDVLGLDTPITQSKLKQRYRQLAMAYHPDRGGDASIFQEINWAFGVLQKMTST